MTKEDALDKILKLYENSSNGFAYYSDIAKIVNKIDYDVMTNYTVVPTYKLEEMQVELKRLRQLKIGDLNGANK